MKVRANAKKFKDLASSSIFVKGLIYDHLKYQSQNTNEMICFDKLDINMLPQVIL